MIEQLAIGEKTTNQGATPDGKLTSQEFNALVDKVKELVENANKTVYLTQDEYDALLGAGEILDDVEYNIYEE